MAEMGSMETGSSLASRDQTEAILKLLSDDDSAMTELVLQQLESDATGGKKLLEALLEKASGRARRVLQAELERLGLGDPEEALAKRCGAIRTLADFEDFCWKMAYYHNPKARIFDGKRKLDQWAERVKNELAPQAGQREQLAALRLVLAQEEQLKGNEENYYDPDNSFVDKVIATKLGLPISLTVVYMLVGARAGIEVEPVGMPGHFIARIGSCYFTPFTEAADIERAKLEETLNDAGFKLDYDILDGTPLALVAQRMVNNLVSIYTQRDDIENLLRWQTVLTWLQEVSLS